MLNLNGIRLRNRLITSSSLLGYGAPSGRSPYGLSPFARFVPLERFGAITTRTLTLEPNEGHFPLREDWRLRDVPDLPKRYRRVLRRTDSGWLNAFGWTNIGIDAYLRDYYPRTAHLNRIVSVGGFAAEDYQRFNQKLSAVAMGEIAAIEFNVSCHNVNFDFDKVVRGIMAMAVRPVIVPIILKLSAESNYVQYAQWAQTAGISGLVAINTVKGLRLDPRTGKPWLANRYGGLSGRAIKPIALRVVAELRDAGITLPIIANGGIRTYDDCREFFHAGADAVSLGSEVWLASYPGYLLAPLRALQIRALLRRFERVHSGSHSP